MFLELSDLVFTWQSQSECRYRQIQQEVRERR